MIGKIKKSLTIKICILITVLLVISSGITYGAIIGVLPTYYSNQLQKDLDTVSQGMIETICSYETIDAAAQAIELFEAGAQVSVVILDEQGEWVWPCQETIVEEAASTGGVVESVQISSGAVAGAEIAVAEESAAAAPEPGIAVAEESAAAAPELGIAASEEQREHSAVKRYSFEMGKKEYTMIVSGGMEPVNQAIGILHQIAPYILGISAFAAILFALAFSLYLTLPIVRLSRIANCMAALDFSSSYQGERTDEVGMLGISLNELSENLSRALEGLKEANARLKLDIEKEREIEKKRIAFFSAVSHELKTPITILKGHLSGMLQGVGEYRNRDYYLQRSQETAEKMEDMVKELLTVSRIENRSFTMHKIDIAEQLRQKIADMAELIENKNLDLVVDIPSHLYAEVNGGMMEKVFSNLLMNAIRYTPEGNGNQIRIVLWTEKTEDGGVSCRIENTGVFIPEESLPQLFEAFYRVEQSRNRQSGGSGLGLYIVRMILDQHGAKYGICNISDGVRFFFSLHSCNS